MMMMVRMSQQKLSLTRMGGEQNFLRGGQKDVDDRQLKIFFMKRRRKNFKRGITFNFGSRTMGKLWPPKEKDIPSSMLKNSISAYTFKKLL
jgi:hypothetical protein